MAGYVAMKLVAGVFTFKALTEYKSFSEINRQAIEAIIGIYMVERFTRFKRFKVEKNLLSFLILDAAKNIAEDNGWPVQDDKTIEQFIKKRFRYKRNRCSKSCQKDASKNDTNENQVNPNVTDSIKNKDCDNLRLGESSVSSFSKYFLTRKLIFIVTY